MAATTISRTNIGTDDDGSGATGTVINAAYIGLAVYDAIDALFSGAGVTFNQGAFDSFILTFESSDVAHGMTGFAGTSAYALMSKYAANDGGLNVLTLTEASTACQIQGFVTTVDTTKSAAAVAPIMFYLAMKNGTSNQAITANGNLVAFQSLGQTRFIFDVEGDSHEDGTGWTAYDAYDDVALIASVESELSRDPLRDEFKSWMTYNRDDLSRARLVTFNEDGHHFVNRSRMQMALCGAVRQLALRCAQQEARLKALEA